MYKEGQGVKVNGRTVGLEVKEGQCGEGNGRVRVGQRGEG